MSYETELFVNLIVKEEQSYQKQLVGMTELEEIYRTQGKILALRKLLSSVNKEFTAD